MRNGMIQAPGSWRNPGGHLQVLLESDWYRLMSRLHSEFSFATHTFFHEQHLLGALLPVTTNSISSPVGLGSDSLPLDVLMRGRKTYLADSMQFFLELALRLHDRGVYYIMPSFRGDPVDERHLCQFFHAEAEIYGGLAEVMGLVSRYVHYLSAWMLERCPRVVESLADSCSHVARLVDLDGQFPAIRFDEAYRLLAEEPGCVARTSEGIDTITSQGERQLISQFGGVVWLTHLPLRHVPFYQQREAATEYSLTADLLMGIGETVGSGERVADEPQLRESLRFHAVDPEPYRWYLDMKRLRPAVTAGFGMGMERYLLWLTNTQDIRDCQLCLRDLRCESYP